MIKLIVLGKIKEQYLNDLISDYVKRINKYLKLEIVELKDRNSLCLEAEDILKHINKKDFIITMEILGKKLNSNQFAELIDKTFINYSNITFIIGSSDGLDDKIKSLSNLSLSFSDFTMPHGLFRGVLLEQIYRALKINNNETYHK